jgi:hypothetical protein
MVMVIVRLFLGEDHRQRSVGERKVAVASLERLHHGSRKVVFADRDKLPIPGIGMGILPSVNQSRRSWLCNDRSLPAQPCCRRLSASRQCLALSSTGESEKQS